MNSKHADADGIDRYDDYDAFAAAYDKHWGQFATAIRPVLDRLALDDLADGSVVVDLCCGTGQLASSLSDRFEVVGIDGSGPMIDIAKRNAPTARFVVADARDFGMGRIGDAMVCTFDSLNHVMAADDLLRVFRNARSTLHLGAPFVFDLNMRIGFDERWGTQDMEFDQDGDHIHVVGDWDADAGVADVTITVTPVSDQSTIDPVSVYFTQACYPEEQVVELLEKAGFSEITVVDSEEVQFGGIGRSFFVAR